MLSNGTLLQAHNCRVKVNWICMCMFYLLWPGVSCTCVRVWKCPVEDVNSSSSAWFQPHDGGWTDRIRPSDVHARRRSVFLAFSLLVSLLSFLPFCSFVYTSVFLWAQNLVVQRPWMWIQQLQQQQRVKLLRCVFQLFVFTSCFAFFRSDIRILHYTQTGCMIH